MKIICVSFLLLTGCSFRTVATPEPIKSWDTGIEAKYGTITKIWCEFHKIAPKDSADDAKKKEARNTIIGELMVSAEIYHEEKDDRLAEGNILINLALDTAQLAASTWSTLAGANTTKSLLSGLSVGLKGFQGHFNSRVFQEATIAAFLTAIRTHRIQKKTILLNNLKKDYSKYTLGEALRDWAAYLQSGGMTDAIVTLGRGVNKAEDEAIADLKDAVK
jgi:hypothetical protein